MTGNILRNWFVPKDGISREVISADIQRFLGNDATVRPGKDMLNGKEVEGYWIRAYRNLTTEMINDLKVASQKWDREQRSGRRVTNYEESHTFRTSNHTGYGITTGSPQLDGPFQPPAPRSALPPQDMPAYSDPRAIYPTHSVPPQTSGYVESPVYASHPSRQPSQSYPAQGDYYGTPSPYGHEPPPQHHRSSPQYTGPQYANGVYGQPPPRDPRDDPRYQPEYQDAPVRYNYPPVTTAVSNGGPVSSPSQQPASYPPPMRYDQYGRPAFSQPPSIPDPPYRPSPSVDASHYARDRPTGPQGGDSRRRRIG